MCSSSGLPSSSLFVNEIHPLQTQHQLLQIRVYSLFFPSLPCIASVPTPYKHGEIANKSVRSMLDSNCMVFTEQLPTGQPLYLSQVSSFRTGLNDGRLPRIPTLDLGGLQLDRTKRKYHWQKARFSVRTRAVGAGAKGSDSDAAMRKEDVDSCLWLSPSQDCLGVSPSIQSSDENAPVVEASDVEKNRLHEHNLRPSFVKTSERAANRSVTVSRTSAQTSKVINSSTGAGVLGSEYRTVDQNPKDDTRNWIQWAEERIERTIFDTRFLALLAVAGSLAGSLLCFLKGCVLIFESFLAFYSMCMIGVHSGKMILRLVEAVDVYLAGTVMLIFGMGLYGLFISNIPDELHPSEDRALLNSSLFGMFNLKRRPKWMMIRSLDELKTKLGHAIVMILLVKMFERSKAITIATSADLLMYSVSVFLSSASLFVLHKLHH